MFDCKMIINKMNIERDKLNISVSISCPFDIDVTSPKAKSRVTRASLFALIHFTLTIYIITTTVKTT